MDSTNASTPREYDETQERRLTLALFDSTKITMPNGSPYFMPGTQVLRERRNMPYFAYKDDNGRWRCGRVCAHEPKCRFQSLCGSMIPPGEEEHRGKHLCSRCHAREVAALPDSYPLPS